MVEGVDLAKEIWTRGIDHPGWEFLIAKVSQARTLNRKGMGWMEVRTEPIVCHDRQGVSRSSG